MNKNNRKTFDDLFKIASLYTYASSYAVKPIWINLIFVSFALQLQGFKEK
ncbi:MAG TPA: hypothetical protein VJ697_15430 [Nitrososphaeraceae archaeon]|nr:hypothetical protein [Nitrososphaeraceae archaeon]